MEEDVYLQLLVVTGLLDEIQKLLGQVLGGVGVCCGVRHVCGIWWWLGVM